MFSLKYYRLIVKNGSMSIITYSTKVERGWLNLIVMIHFITIVQFFPQENVASTSKFSSRRKRFFQLCLL